VKRIFKLAKFVFIKISIMRQLNLFTNNKLGKSKIKYSKQFFTAGGWLKFVENFYSPSPLMYHRRGLPDKLYFALRLN
jgi:hypothetical protein